MRPRAWRAGSGIAATMVSAALALSACSGSDPASGTGTGGPRVGGNGTAGSSTSSTSSTSSLSSSDPTASIRARSTTTTTTLELRGKVDVLEIGDSLGVDLGIGMQDALASSPDVGLDAEAVGDTGLSNEGYYNWPEHLQAELGRYHPQVVVVFVGANDMQGFVENGTIESVGTRGWNVAYGRRVTEMVDEATSAGARVLWVGMPIMESPSFSAEMAQLNSIYRSEMKRHAGARYFSSWSLFANSAGRYVGTKPGPDGQTLLLRDPDGIHLDIDGCNLIGHAVVGELVKLYGLKVRSP